MIDYGIPQQVCPMDEEECRVASHKGESRAKKSVVKRKSAVFLEPRISPSKHYTHAPHSIEW